MTESPNPMFGILSKELKEQSGRDLIVKDVYEANVGCIAYRRPYSTNREGQASSHDRLQDEKEVWPLAIEETLSGSPMVKDMKRGSRSEVVANIECEGEMFVIGNPRRFQLVLPDEQTPFDDLMSFHGLKPIDEYKVFISGSIFLLAARMDRPGFSPSFMRAEGAIREIIESKKEFETDTKDFPRLHDSILVVFLDKGSYPEPNTKVTFLQGDLVIMVPEDKDIDEMLSSMLTRIDTGLIKLFIIARGVGTLDLERAAALAQLSKVTTRLQELDKLPRWRILQSRRIAKEGRRLLRDTRSSIFELRGRILKGESEIDKLLNSPPPGSRPLNVIHPIIVKGLKKPTIIPECVDSWMDSLESEFRSLNDAYTAAILTLVGVFAGAFLTWILGTI